MANGKQLSQKGADFILDLMDSYIDVKEAVAERFKVSPTAVKWRAVGLGLSEY